MKPEVAAAWDTTLSAMIARDSVAIAPWTCPTFPMRPVSGGNLDVCPNWHAYIAEDALWFAEPKYNGWRALVHIETGAMFNRHGKRLSIEKEFQPALEYMRATLDAAAFKWADCEALERRHGIGRGCLIVLDVVPEPDYAAATYAERNDWLRIPSLPPLAYTPDRDLFPLVSRVPTICDTAKVRGGNWRDDMLSAWWHLKEANNFLTPNVKPICRFYEGLVLKNARAPYMIQLRSDNVESPALVKHRWEY